MPAPNLIQNIQEVPVKIVGGNGFGRFPKISREETFNFIVSDNFLVPYAGYKSITDLNTEVAGRGIYASSVGGFMLVVIGNLVYTIDSSLSLTPVPGGILQTNEGDVFMSENNNKQIVITDKVYLYAYDYDNNTFASSDVASGGTIIFDFKNPGYVSFQNGRFIVVSLFTQQWILSGFNDALAWPKEPVNPLYPNLTIANSVGSLQSKPGYIQAVVPVPGGGNNIIVFGSNVAESWQDLGLALFPYQRNSTTNLDYGCLNSASIAELEDFIVWLSVNEQSGPSISFYSGGAIQRISTDGIDFKLAKLTNPTNCTAFLFRQDGHLIYQFTFIDDNLTYAYDFNTKLFFTITDPELNYHPARDVVFFNNHYYFVSLNDGNVYQFGTQYTDAEYPSEEIKVIPRIRVTPPLRFPSQRYFIGKSLGFTIENGQENTFTTVNYEINPDGIGLATESGITIVTEGGVTIDTETRNSVQESYQLSSSSVDLSISRDGGESFGSSVRRDMNPTGKRKSRFIYQRLGIMNDVTFQLRFNGAGRFVVTEGELELWQ